MEAENNIKRISKWIIKGFINEGAYGSVFETFYEDQETKKNIPCVIKWMHSKIIEKEAENRFKNEAWALKTLNDKHFPKFIDFGYCEDKPFIVMTKAPGKSLKKIIEERLAEGNGATFGEFRVLNILIEILEGLTHLHKQGITHRDIKDDNIVTNYSDSNVTIVDLGVSNSKSQPIDINTFRGAVGSSRYSPPSKLEFQLVDPTHDVFAVGVIGYKLLTNQYPWEVGNDSNIGELSKLMKTTGAKDIRNINNTISNDVNSLIYKLIEIKDEERISSQDALKLVKEVREALQKKSTKGVLNATKIKYSHVTLDPIHADVRLTDFEWELLSTPEFQRLRRIKQLGFANLVYIGAEHTRFAHAIGTLFIANKIIDSMEHSGRSFSLEERLAVRTYALLHDITHVPYGHTLEDELNFFKRHDSNYSRINKLVFSDDSNIGELLRKSDYGRVVLGLFDYDSNLPKNWMTEIVDSAFGADVIDYIDRDSYYCGLHHRVDVALFRRLSVTNKKSEPTHYTGLLHGSHGFRVDAEFAIETLLRERYALFLKVYTHQTKIAAGAMLGKALTMRINQADQNFLVSWSKMSDDSLLALLEDKEGDFSATLAKMISNRILYKPIFRTNVLTNTNESNLLNAYSIKHSYLTKLGLFSPQEREKLEIEIAKKAQIDPTKIIIYCSAKAPGLQKVIYHVERKAGEANIIDDSYPLQLEYMKKHIGLWNLYVFAHPNCSDKQIQKIINVSTDFFGYQNNLVSKQKNNTLFD